MPKVARSGWSRYLAEESDRDARALLRDALGRFGTRTGTALDLGSGAGRDTLALLRLGWHVVAMDREPAAIDMLRAATPEAVGHRLRTCAADFTTVPLPAADLIHCGWSLPHVAPDRFAALWLRLRGALRPGGRFVGQILGDRDAWVTQPGTTGVPRDALDALLDGLDVEVLEECEADGHSYGGPKRWHFYEIVARRPDNV
jgi:SAM-dependent methyltransferase